MDTTQNSRVYWSCRRGMLELDLILMPFYLHRYPTLSDELQQDYQALLTATDPELYVWLTGKEEPTEPKTRDIVNLIRDYAIDLSRPRPL
ncbi:MAG: succinate dehydrogenase assembly factor 2 [Legionellales bacterium]|nr:succinate dehydrogenase assembly factor 2 [Legionellales bacterium]